VALQQCISRESHSPGAISHCRFLRNFWDRVAAHKLDDLLDSADPPARRVRIRGATVI
jgi:hypothetical protein